MVEHKINAHKYHNLDIMFATVHKPPNEWYFMQLENSNFYENLYNIYQQEVMSSSKYIWLGQ